MILYSFLLSAMLLAEGGEARGFLSSPELWRVINVLVFVFILVYILRKKVGIGQLFDSRAAAIRKDLEQARRDRQQAEAKLAEVEARLGRLDQELAEIRAQSDREAERESERIRLAAAADAEKIRELARREIDGAMKAARTELRAFVAEQSVSMAETMIRGEIRADDNRLMLNRLLDEMNEVKK